MVTLRPERCLRSGGPPNGGGADGGDLAAAGDLRLEVADVRLIRRSKIAPHFVMARPLEDTVLMGLDPDSIGPEGPPAHPLEAPGEDAMHIDCRKQTGA